jgi:hypothetical protein
MPFDQQVLQLNWVKSFVIVKDIFTSGQPPAPEENTDVTCYTDGSYVAGHAGACYVLFYTGEEVLCDSIHLGTLACFSSEASCHY